MTDSLLKTQAEIIESLRKILPEGLPVTAETHIVRDLHLDSLAVMDFMFSLEAQFDVLVPLEALADVNTVAELSNVIDGLVTQQRRSTTA